MRACVCVCACDLQGLLAGGKTDAKACKAAVAEVSAGSCWVEAGRGGLGDSGGFGVYTITRGAGAVPGFARISACLALSAAVTWRGFIRWC